MRLVAGLRAYGLDYALSDAPAVPSTFGKGARAPVAPRYALVPPLDTLVHCFHAGDDVTAAPALPQRECDAVLHALFLRMRPAVGVAPAAASQGATAATPSARAAATLQQPPSIGNPVLRDFFGRLVAVPEPRNSGSSSSSSSSNSTSGPGAHTDGERYQQLSVQRDALRVRLSGGRDAAVLAQLQSVESQMSELDRKGVRQQREANGEEKLLCSVCVMC